MDNFSLMDSMNVSRSLPSMRGGAAACGFCSRTYTTGRSSRLYFGCDDCVSPAHTPGIAGGRVVGGHRITRTIDYPSAGGRVVERAGAGVVGGARVDDWAGADERAEVIEGRASLPPVNLVVAEIPHAISKGDLMEVFGFFDSTSEIRTLCEVRGRWHALATVSSIHDATNIIDNFARRRSAGEVDSGIFVELATQAKIGALLAGRTLDEVECGDMLNYTARTTPRDKSPGRRAKLYVASLPWHVTRDEIIEVFLPYGEVVGVWLLRPSSLHKGRRSAIVAYAASDMARAAAYALNHRHAFVASTRPIEVRLARRAGTSESDGSSSLSDIDVSGDGMAALKRDVAGPALDPRRYGDSAQQLCTALRDHLLYGVRNDDRVPNAPPLSPRLRLVDIAARSTDPGSRPYAGLADFTGRGVNGWRLHCAANGRFYFYNHARGVSQWEIPVEGTGPPPWGDFETFRVKAQRKKPFIPAPIPPGVPRQRARGPRRGTFRAPEFQRFFSQTMFRAPH